MHLQLLQNQEGESEACSINNCKEGQQLLAEEEEEEETGKCLILIMRLHINSMYVYY